MSTTLYTYPDGGPQGEGRVSVLQGRLSSLGHETAPVDAAVTTCLLWVAGVLLEIAADVGDPRGAGALAHEASAVLAEVPAPTGSVAIQPEALTGRQLTVLRLLQEEVPLRQIADGMYVSHNTVKSHTRAVYRKLGASSRAEAVHRARQLGLV
ncbi:MAG: LuxR C-terminal-related transcriptional regulator [Streptomyces sp.]